MLAKPQDPCLTCPLWKVTHTFSRPPYFETLAGTGFCNPEGQPLLGVAFVAEASGASEEAEGLPLRPYASAGSVHTRLLRSVGASRQQSMAFNVLACRPPNNDLDGERYEMDAITQCAPIRDARIANFLRAAKTQPFVKQPVIVALGDIALRTLTGLAGKYKTISYARGYPIMRPDGILVLGTWHPQYVRYNTKLMGTATHDYRMAFELAREGFKEFPRNYMLYPTTEQKKDFRDRVLALPPGTIERALMWDIETPLLAEKRKLGPDNPDHIDSMQFSLAPGTGIFLGADDHELWREILGSQCAKVGHNTWDFDEEVLRIHHFQLNGISHDVMWMYHHYQPDVVMEDAGAEADNDMRFSTSASLQAVASFYGMDFMWKHYRGTSDDRENRFYGVADVDAVARIIMLGEKGPFGGTLPQQLKEKGLW